MYLQKVNYFFHFSTPFILWESKRLSTIICCVSNEGKNAFFYGSSEKIMERLDEVHSAYS